METPEWIEPGAHDLRVEWGEAGLAALCPTSDAVVIVDVLSFSTCVDIAVSRSVVVLPHRFGDARAAEYAHTQGAELALPRGQGRFSLSPATFLDAPPATKVVLPSPNGAALTLAADHGGAIVFCGCLRNAGAVARAASRNGRRVSVIAAGERWPDGGLRPCLEDWLGAGAILEHLPGTRSPEAEAAVQVFRAFRHRLEEGLRECVSGRELVDRGYEHDVDLAAGHDVSKCAPRLLPPCYVDDGL